jgi:uncharacterized membrane protein HdeD (DUF308 family)
MYEVVLMLMYMALMAFAAKRGLLSRFLGDNRGALSTSGIIALFVGMLVIFYVLSALINPVETAVTDVTNSLANSSFTEVQNIQQLPKVSYLIGLISVIVGIIYIAWGRE